MLTTVSTTEVSADAIWRGAQKMLQTLLNADIYNLWFSPIRAVSLRDDVITLEVLNDFCEVWLTENYLSLLQDTLSHTAAKSIKVTFQVATRGVGTVNSSASTVVGQKASVHPSMVEEITSRTPLRETPFNPNNTFETYVVGNNNNFAHAAASAVAQAPGKSYNPLFLYGGVGLGKTHLLHAIGQHVLAHKKNVKVTYVSSEKFTNEYIDGIQNNSLAKFRKKYRQSDLLLIDDVQFLAGKERIQEEFFHTFNALHEAHRQIVLTCDRPASELQNLEQRLISRFEWGLVTDLQPPEVETRIAILRKKALSMEIKLSDEIINFIATRIRANIRRLEGALVRVASYAALTGKHLSIETAENLLRDILSEEGRMVLSMDTIQKKVAEHYDFRLADMTSKRRPENIAFPRQVAMFLSRQLTDNSLTTIGEAFGGRDHGTVMHACRLIKGRMEVDPSVRQTVNFLERQLQR